MTAPYVLMAHSAQVMADVLFGCAKTARSEPVEVTRGCVEVVYRRVAIMLGAHAKGT